MVYTLYISYIYIYIYICVCVYTEDTAVTCPSFVLCCAVAIRPRDSSTSNWYIYVL